MSTSADTPKNIHQGRNVKRFREMLGWKQEALAFQLGEEWSQKRVSLLEAKEVIEDDILTQVAAINDNSSTLQGYYINYNPTFNPIDKWLEVIEENKMLYERLLASEKEKVDILKGKAEL